MEGKYHVTFRRGSLPYLYFALQALAKAREPDIDTRTMNWLTAAVTSAWQSAAPHTRDVALGLTERHMTIVSRALRAVSLRTTDPAERLRFGIPAQSDEAAQARFAELAHEALSWLQAPRRTPALRA